MKKILVLFFIAGIIFAQAKRAVTIADLYKTKYVGSEVLSPDNSKIVFTVTENNLNEAKSNTDIYIVNKDGSELRRLTYNPAADYNPIWAKDGMGIYFLSTRSGAPQLYFLSLKGGEPKQLTNYGLGISAPKISPDEKGIIFQAKVFPECGADADCNKTTNNKMNNGPIQAHLADSLMLRHWTEYLDGQYSHVLYLNLNNGSVIDLTPGYFNSPTFSAGGSDHYVFSPEGKHVAFDSKRVADPESSTNSDVFIVNTDGSGLINITKENEGYDGNPKYSPDGKYLAYLTQKTPGYESDRFMLEVYDIEQDKKFILTESFDNWVNDFEWAGDSKSIYFTGHQKGYLPLFRVEISNRKIEEIIPKKVVASFDVADDESSVVFNYSQIDKPYEIALFDMSDKSIKDITAFNKELIDSLDFRPPEELWIKGANNTPVHLFLVKPHNFDPDKKYPLVINVHGGPQYQWMNSFRFDWQVYPGAGYVLAFPNPHGSTGYGQEYTAAISKDWDGKVFEDVMKVTDSLANLPFVDKNRIGAMGWSYGGYFMNLLQAKTDRFKCLVSMMGIYDLAEFAEETEELWFPNWDLGKNYQSKSPSEYVDNFKTPTLIITGEKDYRIPYTQSIRYFTNLQLKGIDSRLIIFKNDGHWPSSLRSMPLYYNAHLEWFHKYLGGDTAPWDSKDMVRNNYLK